MRWTFAAVAGIVFVTGTWVGAKEPGGGGGPLPPVCHRYLAEMMRCTREMSNGAELPPEAVEQVREATLEACRAMIDAPGMRRALAKALESCTAVSCADGSWTQCFAEELAAALTVTPPPPPPPPVAPGYDPNR